MILESHLRPALTLLNPGACFASGSGVAFTKLIAIFLIFKD
jgi:hypothetical protein